MSKNRAFEGKEEKNEEKKGGKKRIVGAKMGK